MIFLEIFLSFLAIALPLLVGIAYLTLAERKIIGGMQQRFGPNVVGFFGLLQPAADGLKLLLKETVRRLIRMIDPYSAKKNKANPILAYSTLKPETSSLSASGKSNGARLVSASIDTKNIKNKGKKGIQKYT